MVARAEAQSIPFQLSESQIFANGNLVYSELGNEISSIAQDYVFLNQAWRGGLKEPEKASPLTVTRAKETEMIENIAETFGKVSDRLGIPPDMSLVSEVVVQYSRILEIRRTKVNNDLRREAQELTAGRVVKLPPRQMKLWNF